jgi:hypothetical protein
MKSEAVVLSLVFIFICFLAFLLVGSARNKEKTYLKEKNGIYLSTVAICAAIYGLFLAIYIGENESVYIAFSSSLATLAGFYLVYQTFVSQRKEYEHNRIESRFFELLKIHQSNVQEMRHVRPDKVNRRYVSSRRVFIAISGQLRKAEQELRKIKKLEEILYDYEYKEIAYLIVFFGVSKNIKEGSLKTCLDRNPKFNILSDIVISHFDKIIVKYDTRELEPSDLIKYFGGHQSRLGHYYRHLYQVVTYIDHQESLTFSDKYQYIRMIRAQLSTHEQIVLFYNSLSILGLEWEVKYRIFESQIQKPVEINKCLITKYDLIRNIPSDYFKSSNPDRFYPDVNYEGIELTKDKKLWIKNNYK